MKVVVKFVDGMSPYQAGDVAGFDPKEAAKLMAAKLVIPWDVVRGRPAENTSEAREEAPETKSPEGPTEHKAILDAPVRKARRLLGGARE